MRLKRYGYNEFVARPSLLDQVYHDSSISQSPFKGVMKMSAMIAFIFVINSITVIFKFHQFYSLEYIWMETS